VGSLEAVIGEMTAMRTICGIMVSAGLALAQPQGGGPSSVTATITRTEKRILGDGTAKVNTSAGKFFRDNLGRTRTEWGNTVVISDPRTRTVITLDLDAQVARISTPVSGTGAPAKRAETATPNPTRPRPSQKPVVKLGTKMIGNVLATGYRGEAFVPPGAVGNILPIRQVSEMWRSDQLGIPVMLTTTESFIQMAGDRVTRERVEAYTDVVSGVELDPSLFEVPPGFRVLDPGVAAGSPAP
jgi:hypothetical protein